MKKENILKYFVVNISKCLHTTLADFAHLAKIHFFKSIEQRKVSETMNRNSMNDSFQNRRTEF
jgi:hypothetical protein